MRGFLFLLLFFIPLFSSANYAESVQLATCEIQRRCGKAARFHINPSGVKKIMETTLDGLLSTDQMNKLINQKFKIKTLKNKDTPKACVEDFEKKYRSQNVAEPKKKAQEYCFQICKSDKRKELTIGQTWRYCPISLPAFLTGEDTTPAEKPKSHWDAIKKGAQEAVRGDAAVIDFPKFQLKDTRLGKTKVEVISKNKLKACVDVKNIILQTDFKSVSERTGKTQAFIKDMYVQATKSFSGKMPKICFYAELDGDGQVKEIVRIKSPETLAMKQAMLNSMLRMSGLLYPDDDFLEALIPGEGTREEKLQKYFNKLENTIGVEKINNFYKGAKEFELAKKDGKWTDNSISPKDRLMYLVAYANKGRDHLFASIPFGTFSMGIAKTKEEKKLETKLLQKKVVQRFKDRYHFNQKENDIEKIRKQLKNGHTIDEIDEFVYKIKKEDINSKQVDEVTMSLLEKVSRHTDFQNQTEFDAYKADDVGIFDEAFERETITRESKIRFYRNIFPSYEKEEDEYVLNRFNEYFSDNRNKKERIVQYYFNLKKDEYIKKHGKENTNFDDFAAHIRSEVYDDIINKPGNLDKFIEKRFPEHKNKSAETKRAIYEGEMLPDRVRKIKLFDQVFPEGKNLSDREKVEKFNELRVKVNKVKALPKEKQLLAAKESLPALNDEHVKLHFKGKSIFYNPDLMSKDDLKSVHRVMAKHYEMPDDFEEGAKKVADMFDMPEGKYSHFDKVNLAFLLSGSKKADEKEVNEALHRFFFNIDESKQELSSFQRDFYNMTNDDANIEKFIRNKRFELSHKEGPLQKFDKESTAGVFGVTSLFTNLAMYNPIITDQLETILSQSVGPLLVKQINKQIEKMKLNEKINNTYPVYLPRPYLNLQNEIDASNMKSLTDGTLNYLDEKFIKPIMNRKVSLDDVKDLKVKRTGADDFPIVGMFRADSLQQVIEDDYLSKIDLETTDLRTYQNLEKVITKLKRVKEALYMRYSATDVGLMDTQKEQFDALNNVIKSLIARKNAIKPKVLKANEDISLLISVSKLDDLTKGIEIDVDVPELCGAVEQVDIDAEGAKPHDIRSFFNMNAVNNYLKSKYEKGEFNFCFSGQVSEKKLKKMKPRDIMQKMSFCRSGDTTTSGTVCKFEEAPRVDFVTEPNGHTLKIPKVDCNIGGKLMKFLFGAERFEADIPIIPKVCEGGAICVSTEAKIEQNFNTGQLFNPSALIFNSLKVFTLNPLFLSGLVNDIEDDADKQVNEKAKFKIPTQKIVDIKHTENGILIFSDFEKGKEAEGIAVKGLNEIGVE